MHLPAFYSSHRSRPNYRSRINQMWIWTARSLHSFQYEFAVKRFMDSVTVSNRGSSSAINTAVVRKICTAIYCSPWIYIIFIAFSIYFILTCIFICGLFCDDIITDATPTTSNDNKIVQKELERLRKGPVVDYTELLSRHLPERTGTRVGLGFWDLKSGPPEYDAELRQARPRNSVTYLYTVKVFTCFGLQSDDSQSFV